MLSLFALLMAACSPSPMAPTPTVAQVALNAPKQLATVYVSPTPNTAEQRATRLAITPTPNPSAIPPTATPTVYIGVFIGEYGDDNPIVNRSAAGVQAPPTITPVFTRCSLAANEEILGDRWRTNPLVERGLGCPIEGLVPFSGVQQIFESGAIYQRDTGQMWAISRGDPGQWWALDLPPAVELREASAPPGLLVPEGYIAAMWQGVQGARGALGWAQLPVARGDFAYQRFEGGTLFYDGTAGGVFALLLDGAAYGPY